VKIGDSTARRLAGQGVEEKSRLYAAHPELDWLAEVMAKDSFLPIDISLFHLPLPVLTARQ